MATTTTPETTPATTEATDNQTPATEAAPPPKLNMLKLLGYAANVEADPNNAELPEEETPEVEQTEAASTEGATSEEAAQTEGEGVAKPEGASTEASQQAPAAEEQPRVRKKPKPSVLDQLPETDRSPIANSEPGKQTDPIDAAVERALKKAQETVAPKVDESTLPPEDRKVIELAEYAAKVDAKYADLPQRERAFIQARNNHIASWLRENQVAANSEEFSEYLNSAEYRSFVRSNRPNVSPIERENLKERMIEERAVAKAREESAKSQAELERKLKRIEMSPIIQQAAAEVQNTVLDVDDEVVKQVRENPQAAMEANPVEAPIIHELATKARTLASEYLEIAQGVKQADGNNPIHVELDKFIEARGQQLEQLPESQRMRNGKVLVSPARWRDMNRRGDPNINKYETFSVRDTVNLIAETHKGAISIRLDAHRKALEKAGYTRQRANAPTTAPAKPATESAKPAAKSETSSPKSVATRAAGPSGKPATKQVSIAAKALGYAR